MFSQEIGSIIGLTLLFIDLWAITKIFQSPEGNTIKLLWVVTVALIPLFGFVCWFFMGPRKEQPDKQSMKPHL